MSALPPDPGPGRHPSDLPPAAGAGAGPERELRRLLRLLAAHPVLPPAEVLPAADEGFRTLLAELAQGDRSPHARLLAEVSAELAVPVEELARRAEFLLACLVVPASGTYYEILGVAPTATSEEIRRRWAALIQRYHPDRRGGEAGGLDAQVRRLIEAYQTLRDPERRRAYDAGLAREPGRVSAPRAPRVSPRRPRVAGWIPVRWMPLGIVGVGLAVALWIVTQLAPAPLPVAPIPAAPKLLEQWGRSEEAPTARRRSEPPPARPQSALPRPDPGTQIDQPPRPEPARPAEPAPELSLRERLGFEARQPRADRLPGGAEGPTPRAPARPPNLPAPDPPGPSHPRSQPAELPTGRAPVLASPPVAAPAPTSGPPPERVVEAPPAPAPVSPSQPGGVPQAGATGTLVILSPAAAAPSAPPAAPQVAPQPPGSAPPAHAVPSKPQGQPPSAPASARPTAPSPAATPPAPSAPPSAAAPPSLAFPPTAPPAAAPPAAPTPPRVARPKGVAPPPGPTWLEEALGLIEAFRGAYERKDLARVMALLGAEPRERDVAGRAALEQLYARNFAALNEIRYGLSQLTVSTPATDGVVRVEGRFHIQARNLGRPGWSLDVTGPIRWTIRREAGALRIVGIDYEATAR